MGSINTANEQENGPTLPMESAFTEAEQAVLEELWWAKERELVRVAPGRKLLRLVSPDDEELYWTLVSDPQPRLIFHEPVRFTVTVQAVKQGCNVGHSRGDRWEFSRSTPAGICSSAFHTMYPVLRGLSMTSGLYDGPAADGTLVSCPDGGEVTFRIERDLWTPAEWEAADD
jgi:uncharacterized repeat protein (TIGR04076 family)